jgi:hypothetical protein
VRRSSILTLVLCIACGSPETGEDAGMRDPDAGTDAGAIEEPLQDLDGTPRLSDCPEGAPSLCADEAWERARWHFYFACPITSIWRVMVDAQTPATLAILGSERDVIDAWDTPDLVRIIELTSLETLGLCTAVVELEAASRFAISIVQVEPPLDDAQCDELCLSDSLAGALRGCDCERTCHDACRDLGTDCGLPCNRDVPDYACPFLEPEIQTDPDCQHYADDTGSFEHVGTCYRCGTGQQCCYTDGRDNGTGSFDICPPLDPGDDDPDPYACSGPFEHCDCDVTPLCGCMAESGDLALCAECIGEGNFDLFSCNAPGDDATFCQRAADAALAGFSWCAIVGDPERCFDLPADF